LRIFFRLLAYTTRHKGALCLAGLPALAEGCVVECGTHESLLAAGRTYAHLYERQHIAAL
jgi:hypothetical protein